MDMRNKIALAWLLAGISAAGRALLAMPEGTQLQELSLTALALVGYLLVCRKSLMPLLCGVGQLILELILCGGYGGSQWIWLEPVLRAADLWLLLAASAGMLRLAGQPCRAMPAAAALPLAVYTVAHFFSQAAAVASISFVLFSVVLIWYAVLMLRAYSQTCVKP